MSEFDNDALARRLTSIEVPFDADLLTRRVLSATDRRLGRRPAHALRFLIAVPLVLILVSATMSYYAPVFAQAVADAPVAGSVAGWLLRQVGLAGAPHRLTMFGERATSSGHTIELVGGYADAGRTVLFLRVDPPAIGFSPFAPVQVTDQFGQSYFSPGAAWKSDTGEGVLMLRPVEGLAAKLGARLRIVITEIQEAPPNTVRIPGRWELTATLAVEEGQEIPTPDAIALGDARLTFTQVRALSTALLVEFDVENADPASLGRIIPDGLKGRPAFRVRLIAPNGQELQPLQGGGSAQRQGWLWAREGAGRYELIVEWEGVGTGTRALELP